MDALIVAVSQFLLFLVLLAAAVIWLYLPRTDKVGMAAQAIVAVVIMVVLIKLAAGIYTDPRPFVVDPSIKPLFATLLTTGSRPTTPHWLRRSPWW
ncbi:MAG TPA: hypothetical protein VF378_09760 [Geothrix sp.]